MADNNNNVTGWVGWVYLAGILMVVGGLAQAIIGFTALLDDKFVLATSEHLVIYNVTAWGWVHLLVGLFTLAAGLAVMQGSNWGRIVGVFFASVALLANLTYVASYPIWSILAIGVDLLVIYALMVHGGELKNVK